MTGKQKFILGLVLILSALLAISGILLYLFFYNPFILSEIDKINIINQIIFRAPELVRDIFNSLILILAVLITATVVRRKERNNILQHLTRKSREIINEHKTKNAILNERINHLENEKARLNSELNIKNISLNKIAKLMPEIYESNEE